ncbi:GNAT family N-acetyltransferase [Streptomyces sp. SCSIO ZS0520]|uniref:GNAT family N-acetyltransferase n=1 Tax=Streptomyces sp. SCSIO ZS0520 TaxID=2892996 RepID=UPI0021DA5B9D|nr:GNAT family N-acetyltransferase [Streptomyces sp. SCSIO ZS0520]
MVTNEGIAQWREFIEETERQPAHLFCRVVRQGDEIIGFLCGRRDEGVSLGPMYLLPQAQGRSIGRNLMTAFLTWATDAPIRLWVTAYNERAIDFYQHYGFEDHRRAAPVARQAAEPPHGPDRLARTTRRPALIGFTPALEHAKRSTSSRLPTAGWERAQWSPGAGWTSTSAHTVFPLGG